MKGNITVLGMYQLQGGMNNQSELFSLNTAQALTTAKITTTATEDPATNWMDPNIG
jgi:hypothetical protein